MLQNLCKMRAGQKSKLITHILSCITSVICFLLLHFFPCSYNVVGSLWSFIWDQLSRHHPLLPFLSSPPPLPFTWLPIHPSIWFISYISSCITSVICLLLLDISVQCYFNLTSYFFRKIKKKLQLLISDNANYFCSATSE